MTFSPKSENLPPVIDKAWFLVSSSLEAQLLVLRPTVVRSTRRMTRTVVSDNRPQIEVDPANVADLGTCLVYDYGMPGIAGYLTAIHVLADAAAEIGRHRLCEELAKEVREVKEIFNMVDASQTVEELLSTSEQYENRNQHRALVALSAYVLAHELGHALLALRQQRYVELWDEVSSELGYLPHWVLDTRRKILRDEPSPFDRSRPLAEECVADVVACEYFLGHYATRGQSIHRALGTCRAIGLINHCLTKLREELIRLHDRDSRYRHSTRVAPGGIRMKQTAEHLWRQRHTLINRLKASDQPIDGVDYFLLEDWRHDFADDTILGQALYTDFSGSRADRIRKVAGLHGLYGLLAGVHAAVECLRQHEWE